MGYTHYFYRTKRFDSKKYEAVVADLQKLLPVFEHVGLKLAGGAGYGEPVITKDTIMFNGVTQCGHDERKLGITWPAKNATGVRLNEEDSRGDWDISGNWFAGAKLRTRTCGGDCSHETFDLPKVFETQVPRGDGTFYEREATKRTAYRGENGKFVYTSKSKVGKYFDFCKTAFKPYDLAVICALIIAKHHLGTSIIVSSDGDIEQWEDGIAICIHFLGYGAQFRLDDE